MLSYIHQPSCCTLQDNKIELEASLLLLQSGTIGYCVYFVWDYDCFLRWVVLFAVLLNQKRIAFLMS